MLFFFIYLLIGAISGVLLGLLGVGGGIIIVPLLTFLLPLAGIPQDFVVHMAVATSLATIIVTSSSAAVAHHRRGAIDWKLVQRLLPLLILGVVIGAISATHIPGFWLAKLIAVVIFIIALRLMFKKEVVSFDPQKKQIPEPQWRFVSLNILFGFLSAMFGVGGGTFLIPYLNNKLHKTMQQAMAISSVTATMLALAATISYIVLGYHMPQVAPWTTGYIYWPAFTGIALASVICAPFGVQLAHKLPSKQLRYIFLVLLLVVAVKMAV